MHVDTVEAMVAVALMLYGTHLSTRESCSVSCRLFDRTFTDTHFHEQDD